MIVRKERKVSFSNPSQKHDNSFYRKKAWRDRRKAVLMIEPFCRECMAEGNLMTADVVDHIVPRVRGGADFDWDNLQPLCIEHHNKKTRDEQLQNKRGNFR